MKNLIVALIAIAAPAAVYVAVQPKPPAETARLCCVEDPPCPWVTCAVQPTPDQQRGR